LPGCHVDLAPELPKHGKIFETTAFERALVRKKTLKKLPFQAIQS
jgi:hypothetical protein